METNSQTLPVRLDGVDFRYGSGTLALEGIDLALRKGEFVSLVGPSGCGKSTLLRIVAGLLKPSSGLVSRRDGGGSMTGFVFQSPTLLPWRTVVDNVTLPLELAGMGRRERLERAKSLLDLVGLSEFARNFPAQLSGGMKMRVSIARAISGKPSLLLLDEPFAALDDMTRSRLQEELLALREREGFATLFVTHNVSESVFLSDRVLCFSPRPGRIVGEIGVPFGTTRDPELRTDAHAAELAREISHRLREAHP